MTKREHIQSVVILLQEILAEKNARMAAQHKLYLYKASLLTKNKGE